MTFSRSSALAQNLAFEVELMSQDSLHPGVKKTTFDYIAFLIHSSDNINVKFPPNLSSMACSKHSWSWVVVGTHDVDPGPITSSVLSTSIFL